MSFVEICLIVSTLGLFLIPLIPGFFELVFPTDTSPLRVARSYDSNSLNFADGFRDFIYSHFKNINCDETSMGQLENGLRYQIISENQEPSLDAHRTTRRIIISDHNIKLPKRAVYHGEAYSKYDIATEERGQFRALYAENNMYLGEHNLVLRWAHSGGTLRVGDGSKIFGRMTATQKILLGTDVSFERVYAPTIQTDGMHSIDESEVVEHEPIEEFEHAAVQMGRRWVMTHPIDYPERYEFEGDIIAPSINIGAHAVVKGSLKSNESSTLLKTKEYTAESFYLQSRRIACNISDDVNIEKAVVSTHDIYIGNRCTIGGPIIAENIIIIGAGSVIGSPAFPTTITAPYIILEKGCVIHGTLWATKQGIVHTPSLEEGVSI